jgi:putative MATE family efflux protein
MTWRTRPRRHGGQSLHRETRRHIDKHLDRDLDREIVRLAVPAFLALVAEPLFLLADAAIVGHLGTASLAGLGIAGAVLQSAVGLCVFLAYGTTASVARRIGGGDVRGALEQGVDGVWLAVLIGVVTTGLGVVLSARLVGLFNPTPAVAEQATTYLRIAFLGVVPLLVMLAATGILRGLQDTRTPLAVGVAGNLLNVALNLTLVNGLGWGIAGSAVGSDLAQLASALALLVVVVRGARRHGASLRPDLPGVRRAARGGVALVVRTLTLRASLLVMTYAAAALGTTAVATHQLALTVWTFLAFALDAIAIAAQAITGRSLGAGDVGTTRAATTRMVRWGIYAGVVTGAGLALLAPVLGVVFTEEPAVRDLLTPVLLTAAIFQPVAGVVFVLDGVLIGAGDGRYLAWAGTAVLAVFAPLVWLTLRVTGSATGHAASHVPALVWLWAVFGLAFMGSRAVVLLHRGRGSRWMVTGI